MPVRRFRSVEEMTPPPETSSSDPAANLRAAIALSRTCLALDGRRPPAGVRKFRSADEAWAARQVWERAASAARG